MEFSSLFFPKASTTGKGEQDVKYTGRIAVNAVRGYRAESQKDLPA